VGAQFRRLAEPPALVPRPTTAAAPLSVFLNHRTQKLDKTMWSVFLDQRNSTRIAGNLSRFGGQRGIGFLRRGAGMGQDWIEPIGRPAIRLGGKWAPGAHHPAPGAEDAISHLPDGMAVADERFLRQKRSAGPSGVEVGADGTGISAAPGETPVILAGCSADPGGNARFSGEPGKATCAVPPPSILIAPI
jgi:hypothetical protein